MKKGLILIVFLVYAMNSMALEVDEKLTLRLIKVSKTKKTVLINRGLEDGLVEGDHAKFFLTTGVVARGVVVKASPTRSIWSVYRVIDREAVFKDKVMNLKITKGMKLSEDQTKDIVAEKQGDIDVPPAIALAPGANDLDQLKDEDKRELEALGGGGSTDNSMRSSDVSIGISRKTVEVFGLLNFNNMSSSSDLGDGITTTGTNASLDFSFGIEKYFDSQSKALRNFSMSAFFHKSTHEAVGISGTQVSLDAFGYGVGANYHFIADALSYGRGIGFANFTIGVGSTQDSISFQTNTVSSDPQSLDGNSTFFSVGMGFKFFLKDGLGARALLDWYQRGEKYALDDGTEYTKTVSGPRVQVGIGYRW
ncbi:MAG: hypothetical protein KC493_04880 [Bacteriovoracaceae bacterium]|nr:hypothetical protein [Bacteriovoracaceae bacterium]